MTKRYYYVYHIHFDGMGLDEGYIGVSVEPKKRWAAHRTSDQNPYLKRVINKYRSEVKYTILSVHDNPEEAYWCEFTLRPFDRIGWNILKGGSRPPVNDRRGEKAYNYGKKLSDETKRKISESLSNRVLVRRTL